MVVLCRRPPRLGLTAQRPPLAAPARLARGRVAVHPTPARSRGVLPSRHRRGSLVALPSLRPGPTARRPPARLRGVLPSRRRRGCIAIVVIASPPDRAASYPRGGSAACPRLRRDLLSARHGRVVAVHRAPARQRGVLPSRRRLGLLGVSPSLRSVIPSRHKYFHSYIGVKRHRRGGSNIGSPARNRGHFG